MSRAEWRRGDSGPTWREVVERLSSRLGMPRAQAEVLARQVFDVVLDAVRVEGRVAIPHVGVFSRRTRKARRVLVPGTGRPMRLGATASVGFRLSRSRSVR